MDYEKIAQAVVDENKQVHMTPLVFGRLVGEKVSIEILRDLNIESMIHIRLGKQRIQNFIKRHKPDGWFVL